MIDAYAYRPLVAEAAGKVHPDDREDFESDGLVALYELAGGFAGDDDAFRLEAAGRLRRLATSYRFRRRNLPLTADVAGRRPEPDDQVELREAVGRAGRWALNLTTPKRRAKYERNLVICAAVKAGASQRLVARVFGLPRSRIAAIVRGCVSTRG